jgi:hypothetical protein
MRHQLVSCAFSDIELIIAGPNLTLSDAQPSRFIDAYSTANFTIDFLSFPANSQSDICVFSYYESERNLYYPTIAFPVLNSTRDKPMYYNYANPNGTEYVYSDSTGVKVGPEHQKSLVGPIVGGVLGGVALLAIIIVGLVFWERRRRRKVKEIQKLGGVELQDDGGSRAPPPYTPAAAP